MSLFVGNVSRNIRAEDLEEAFDKIGPCQVNFKGSFAFVEYKDERDAEDAISELNGKELGGQKMAIEWSKKSGRFDPKNNSGNSRPRPMSRRDDGSGRTTGCYNCGKIGHFARDCRGRRRSRSRSMEGGYRGARSPRHDSPRRGSPKNSPKRDERPRKRSRSDSYSKKDTRKGGKSRSSSRASRRKSHEKKREVKGGRDHSN